MKSLVIFYSFTGKSCEIANELAKKENADIVELIENKKRSVIGAYVAGSLAARRQRTAKLAGFNCDFSNYNKITIVMPIWAGFPAPPMNNIINALPAGKDIELVMTSGSGNSSGSREKTKALIEEKGCCVVSYRDIKS